MKYEAATLLVLLGAASARPDASSHVASVSSRVRREVPQEHSHEKIITSVRTSLNLNNVDQVSDPIFALLGNAAAAKGAGKVTDLDCLQQRVADQAFTNAKAAGDVAGQANALIFRALERNTGSVGLKSVLCASETAKNPEVAALTQHQDPASDGAAAGNKQIALTLAAQLASIGADPQLALLSGTFAPGDKTDNTGKGNSCDDTNDPEGCIFTQKLIVNDATPAEIDAAAKGGAGAGAGGAAGGAAGNGTAVNNGAAGNATAVDAGCAAPPPAASAAPAAGTGKAATPTTPAAGAGGAAAGGAASGANVNTFTGTVGAPPVPVISSASARPFNVGGDTFINIGAAVQRACDKQKNACANAANSGAAAGIKVSDCDAQQQQCVAANGAKRRRAYAASIAY